MRKNEKEMITGKMETVMYRNYIGTYDVCRFHYSIQIVFKNSVLII